MAPSSIVQYQPLKAIHSLFALSFAFLHLPLWAVYFIPCSLRQSHQWTYRQAITNVVLRIFLRHVSATRKSTPLSLEAGAEKDRFVVMHPTKDQTYSGAGATDPAGEIQPQPIGSTWFPAPYDPDAKNGPAEDGYVILHFHGGAYVIGDGRTSNCGFLAETLLAKTSASHVLCPQYRLASTSDTTGTSGRFPAALQDAVTAYAYLLTELRIPPSRIVLSGDSAGGHLALALLRYIAENRSAPSADTQYIEVAARELLPAPRCAWVFSPWCDIAASLDKQTWSKNRNYRTDYVPASLARWGAQAYFGDRMASDEVVYRYAAPLQHSFVMPCPVLAVAGGNEVLCDDISQLVTGFNGLRENLGRVKLHVEKETTHDIIMMGWAQGFRKEAEACAVQAEEFLRTVTDAGASGSYDDRRA